MTTYREAVNRINIVAILLMFILSYTVWTVGLNNPFTIFIYSNGAVLYTLMISFLLIINVPNYRLFDYIFLGFGIGSAILYSCLVEMREEALPINILFFMIISFVIVVSKTRFNSIDYFIFTLFLSIVLSITIYRIFTELPEKIGDRSIWDFNNKLSDIWINTNTIGFSLLTLGMLITGLLEYYYHIIARILSLIVSIATLISIYVTQSKASLIAMITFILLLLLYKLVKSDTISLIYFYSVQLLLALPLSIIAATSKSINLFTGREEIWAEFYRQFFSNTYYILFGMKQFVFQRGESLLGYHNSYNNIIGIYGFIGLIIFALFVLFFAGRVITKYYLTPYQVTFYIAFFAILIQSYMEDTLVSFNWLPIVYFFLGFASRTLDEDSKADLDKFEEQSISIGKHYEKIR